MKRALKLLWLTALLPGCPALVPDPPPPPRKAEIPSAAPQARGALAAGTDAAPRPEIAPPAALGGGETETPTPEPAPEGAGGAPTPAPTPPPAPTNGLL